MSPSVSVLKGNGVKWYTRRMMSVLSTTSAFGSAAPAARDELRGAGLLLVENPHKRKLTEDEVLELLRRHQPVGLLAGMEPLSARVLESARGHLKVISRVGTGMENVDLSAAKRLGIPVFNTPDAPAQAVAEMTIGLILSALRRIAEADRSIREGRWQSLMGALLAEKTLGIVGYGRIGSRVARIAAAFGCRVLACDERPFKADAVRKTSFEELLREADIVTLHLPLDASTRRIIDAERLSMMKAGAVLINASRGGLVNEAALAEALRSGRLSGAGLDAFEDEPYQGPLRDIPNVVLTAHMGSAARECRARMEHEAVANLIAGLRDSRAL